MDLCTVPHCQEMFSSHLNLLMWDQDKCDWRHQIAFFPQAFLNIDKLAVGINHFDLILEIGDDLFQSDVSSSVSHSVC